MVVGEVQILTHPIDPVPLRPDTQPVHAVGFGPAGRVERASSAFPVPGCARHPVVQVKEGRTSDFCSLEACPRQRPGEGCIPCPRSGCRTAEQKSGVPQLLAMVRMLSIVSNPTSVVALSQHRRAADEQMTLVNLLTGVCLVTITVVRPDRMETDRVSEGEVRTQSLSNIIKPVPDDSVHTDQGSKNRNWRNASRLAKDRGMGSVNWLVSRISARRLPSLPSSDGRDPVSRLSPRYSVSRLARSPSSGGIGPCWCRQTAPLPRLPIDPVSRLSTIVSVSRLARSPSSGGMDPVSWLVPTTAEAW